MIIIAFNAVNLHLIILPKKMTGNEKKKSAIALNLLYATKEDIFCIRFKT